MPDRSILAKTLDEMIAVFRSHGLIPVAAQVVHVSAEGAQTRIMVEVAEVGERDDDHEQRPERVN